MPYNTPITWVAGDVLTAAQLNAQVRDNIAYLANPPAAMRRSSTAQLMNNAGDNLVTFTSTDQAQGGCTFPTPQTIAVPIKGIYNCSGTLRVPSNATAGFDEATLYVYTSGGVFVNSYYNQGVPTNIAGTDASFNPSGPIWLSAGDRVALRFWTNRGARNNVVGGVGGTTLAVVYAGLW